MNSTVEEWLRSLNLVAYTQAFLDNGYDELDICKEIGEEDLDAIGVLNRRDRGDILNAVDRLKTGGTAVYFVLEQCDEPKPSPVQLRRESFEPLKLRLLLHAKLEEDKINLAVSPYTNAVSMEAVELLIVLFVCRSNIMVIMRNISTSICYKSIDRFPVSCKFSPRISNEILQLVSEDYQSDHFPWRADHGSSCYLCFVRS